MKIGKLILVLLLCLGVFLGCTPKNPSQTDPSGSQPDASTPGEEMDLHLPQIPEDYIALLCGNTRAEINKSSYSRTVFYQIISGKPLTPEELQLSFDQDVPFTFSLTAEEEPYEPDAVTAAAYQGADWKKLSGAAGMEVLQKCSSQLTAIPQEQRPKLYSGLLTIQFLEGALVADTTLTQLTLTYGENTKTYDIGSIHLSSDSLPITTGGGLYSQTMSVSDVNADPSGAGAFAVRDLTVAAAEDLTIDKAFFPNPETQPVELSYVVQLPDGNVVNSVWDGTTPISMAAGDTITFHLTGTDTAFQNTLVGNTQVYLIFQYTCQGVQYEEYCEMSFRMRSNPFQYYASQEDGLDIVSYYTAYLPKADSSK